MPWYANGFESRFPPYGLKTIKQRCFYAISCSWPSAGVLAITFSQTVAPDYNAGRDRGDGRLTDFIGHFVLALMLIVLLRVLYAVCALLVRTRDGGNIAFAIALPAGLLYIVVRNPVPVTSWAGLAAGVILGAGLLLADVVRRRRRS